MSGGATWTSMSLLKSTSPLPTYLSKNSTSDHMGNGVDQTALKIDPTPTIPPHGMNQMAPRKRDAVNIQAGPHDVASAFVTMVLGVMLFLFVMAVAVKVGIAVASYNEAMWDLENGEDDIEAQPLFTEHARLYVYG